jgi:hypothetical protein
MILRQVVKQWKYKDQIVSLIEYPDKNRFMVNVAPLNVAVMVFLGDQYAPFYNSFEEFTSMAFIKAKNLIDLSSSQVLGLVK